jgi:hypothetical protein
VYPFLHVRRRVRIHCRLLLVLGRAVFFPLVDLGGRLLLIIERDGMIDAFSLILAPSIISSLAIARLRPIVAHDHHVLIEVVAISRVVHTDLGYLLR